MTFTVNPDTRTVEIKHHSYVLTLQEQDVQALLSELARKKWAQRKPLSHAERQQGMVVSSVYEDNHQ